MDYPTRACGQRGITRQIRRLLWWAGGWGFRTCRVHCSPGPCITNVIATCRKNFSQWERSFLCGMGVYGHRCRRLRLYRCSLSPSTRYDLGIPPSDWTTPVEYQLSWLSSFIRTVSPGLAQTEDGRHVSNCNGAHNRV